MCLNDAGRMIAHEWNALASRFPGVEPREFAVMPNHVHGIIWLARADAVGAPLVGAQGTATRAAPTLGAVVGTFKSITTNAYIRAVKEHAWPAFPGRLWQRNYYEHVVRDDEWLDRLRRSIEDNPAMWADDEENPDSRK